MSSCREEASRAQATELHTCCPWDEPSAAEIVNGGWFAETGYYRIPIRQGETLWFSTVLQDLQAADLAASLPLAGDAEPVGHLELNVVNEAGEPAAGDHPLPGARRNPIPGGNQQFVFASMTDGRTELTQLVLP